LNVRLWFINLIFVAVGLAGRINRVLKRAFPIGRPGPGQTAAVGARNPMATCLGQVSSREPC